MLVVVGGLLPGSTADGDDHFEQHVRPLLIERCSQCHGSKKQQAGLRVDSLDGLLRGGDTEPAIVPGDAANSLLVSAIRREGGLEMPPNEELSEPEILAIEAWIDAGAKWPKALQPAATTSPPSGRDHWAFQPVKRPPVPQLDDPADREIRTPVDAFVVARLAEQGLQPSLPADRRTLIRRLSYTLTGLPPTFDEVTAFVNDQDPLAYEKLVERLLQSPQYAEHWARHWLDVARYSDTKGYVYAREERFWTQAWTYRDWVVNAIRDDMPYDRFLLLQLAADQVADSRRDDLAAMGLLTLGRRFLGVRRDIIDDRIDVVCRGTMGLTVSCARCHDHKYDPIPTADYYSLYGVFDSCYERQTVLTDTPGDEAFQAELKKRQTTLQEKLQQRREEASQRARQRIADYLFAQTELHKFPADGFDQIFQASDLLPAFVRQWERYLRNAKRNHDPVFVLWHAYKELPVETFEAAAEKVTLDWQDAGDAVNAKIAAAFVTPPKSFREVCDRYGQVFAAVDMTTEAPDAETAALHQVLDSPACRVPEGPVSHCETFFDSGSLTELWKLQGEIDRWLINAPQAVPVAVSLVDQATPVEPRIFRRGNPLKLGEDVPRQFLVAISEPTREPFQTGSGRLELAQSIIDPNNPLTARVLVNRVWTHHFGAGLVTTPSDFGLRADPPSHPLLLDWLATEFVDSGWSLKALHRWIVLSATFRQRSSLPEDPQQQQQAFQVDPENRLLWRMNPRRMSFEELRDSLFAVSGELDESVGGKPAKMFAPPFMKRRSLYGLIDRQYFPTALRMFDFANPDLHVPQRNQTTVPQQALFFMNHPLVLERAQALADAVRDQPPRRAIENLFQQIYQRPASEVEIADALALLKVGGATEVAQPSDGVAAWSYGYGSFDESTERTAGYTALPHFTGDAWQGGPAWPDATLGWVQLTATGGHPGNTRQHAAIRRWTAPRAMSVSIRSKLTHQPAAGDGIRAMVISNLQGRLQSTKIHMDSADVNVDSVDVQAGETIDFLVDIDQVLNSDQYLWQVTIAEQPGRNTQPRVDGPADGEAPAAAAAAASWNSVTDFPSNTAARLDELAQLAHVLLCTNEFLFLD